MRESRRPPPLHGRSSAVSPSGLSAGFFFLCLPAALPPPARGGESFCLPRARRTGAVFSLWTWLALFISARFLLFIPRKFSPFIPAGLMLVAFFFGILLGVVVSWRRYYHTKDSFYPISAYRLGWGILIGEISRFFIVRNIETIRLLRVGH